MWMEEVGLHMFGCRCRYFLFCSSSCFDEGMIGCGWWKEVGGYSVILQQLLF
jgi:hypothetical protein